MIISTMILLSCADFWNIRCDLSINDVHRGQASRTDAVDRSVSEQARRRGGALATVWLVVREDDEYDNVVCFGGKGYVGSYKEDQR